MKPVGSKVKALRADRPEASLYSNVSVSAPLDTFMRPSSPADALKSATFSAAFAVSSSTLRSNGRAR